MVRSHPTTATDSMHPIVPTPVGPVQHKALELRLCAGARYQKALQRGCAQCPQTILVFNGFHTLGDHGQLQFVRQRNDGTYNRKRLLVL